MFAFHISRSPSAPSLCELRFFAIFVLNIRVFVLFWCSFSKVQPTPIGLLVRLEDRGIPIAERCGYDRSACAPPADPPSRGALAPSHAVLWRDELARQAARGLASLPLSIREKEKDQSRPSGIDAAATRRRPRGLN
jgi:hypothetical protein